MSAAPAKPPSAPDDPARCLARTIAAELGRDPSLEAVTVDRAEHKLAFATLGRADAGEVRARLSRLVDAAQVAGEDEHCGLLAGRGDCATCDTPLDGPAAGRVTVRQDGDKVTIARVTCPTAPKFWRWRELPLPRVVQRDVEFLEHAEAADEWKAQLLAAVLCGACGIAGWALSRFGAAGWSPLAYALAYLAGGWFPAVAVWERLRQRTVDVHFLMLAVAAGSAVIGAWGEGAVLLFLFSFSGALEHYALGRTQKEIRSLFREAPKVATLLDARDREREIPVDQLRAGMKLRVKPGAQFPVDAEVLRGATAADESNLTGEALPVEKAVGDLVLAGTMNLWGAVDVAVLRPAAESSLQKIIRLIREAQHQKAPSQRFTDRFSTWYTYGAMGLSLTMFFVWWLGFGRAPLRNTPGQSSAFYLTMTLLVVSSPCALVLSIPSAVLAAIAWGARHGILLRGGAAVEKLADVNVVAMDKTGTLTTGELRVERVESHPPGREAEVARLVFSMERLSTHPLARALTRHGKQQGFAPVEFEHFESVTGQGLKARRDGGEFFLGRREWVAAQGAVDLPPTAAGDGGASEVWFRGAGLLGRVVLRDDLRPQARGVVEALRGAGLRTVVLTGDRRASAEQLQRALHLDDVRAELKPEDKVKAIQALSREGRVAMVGDGVNDAPSLAAAHVGVAMGARGADAALEQADLVLMHDRLENFLAAFRLSQRARRIIRQNLFISLGTVAVLVGFALAGQVPLPVGVVGHEGSTVVVVMNSLRLLFRRNVAAPAPPA